MRSPSRSGGSPRYAAAGADVLYAPGVYDRASIRAIVEAVAPKPINVLIGAATDLSVSDLAALGVRRVSVGSALARVAWSAFSTAAKGIAGGDFSGFDGILTTSAISGWFRR